MMSCMGKIIEEQYRNRGSEASSITHTQFLTYHPYEMIHTRLLHDNSTNSIFILPAKEEWLEHEVRYVDQLNSSVDLRPLLYYVK